MLRISFTILVAVSYLFFIFYVLEPDVIIFGQDSIVLRNIQIKILKLQPPKPVLRPTGQALRTITTVAILLVR